MDTLRPSRVGRGTALQRGLDRGRVLEVGYLSGQALVCVAWWLALATLPGVRARFELAPGSPQTLNAFVAADLAVFVMGSALGAWGMAHRAGWAPMVVAGTAGGAAYATLYLASWVSHGGAGLLGVVPMVGATVVTSAIARRASAFSPRRGWS